MFEEGVVVSDDDCKRALTCFRQGFSMQYVYAMPSSYDNIRQYISMWRVIIINDMF